MKKRVWIAAALFLMLAAGALWAQEGFQEHLATALREYGYSAEEAGAVVRQQAEWRLAEGADAEGVALALRYASTRERIGPQEQARLAVQAAVGLKEMNAVGLSNREAAGTLLRAMRQVMSESGSATQAGELLRQRLRSRIRLATADHARERLREQAGERLRDQPGELVPGGPGSGYRWGGPGGRR
jgi:hypothetical protein